MGVARFVQVRLVRPGAPLAYLGSFGFVFFVRLFRCVYYGSHGSSGWALGFHGFVRVCQARAGVLWRLLCSITFVRVRVVRPGAPLGLLGSIGFR